MIKILPMTRTMESSFHVFFNSQIKAFLLGLCSSLAIVVMIAKTDCYNNVTHARGLTAVLQRMHGHA